MQDSNAATGHTGLSAVHVRRGPTGMAASELAARVQPRPLQTLVTHIRSVPSRQAAGDAFRTMASGYLETPGRFSRPPGQESSAAFFTWQSCASYAVRVPRTGASHSASFRLHMAVKTLAVPVGVPGHLMSPGDFHPLATSRFGFPPRLKAPGHDASRHAWRTKKTPGAGLRPGV